MYKNIINIKSFQEKAKTILPPEVFSFITSGSLDELTLKRNKNKFNEFLIEPRVLCGIKKTSTEVNVLGAKLNAPFIIAPTAYQKLLSLNGELDMLEAINQFNIIYTVGMFSTIDYEVLAQKSKNSLWIQMYLLKDRSVNQELIRVAERANFKAIMLTVDTPVYAKRESEIATPLQLPKDISFEHLSNIGIPFKKYINTKKHFSELLDPVISWKDIEWLAKQTKLPIILKGILSPKDTKIALEYNSVKGIVISNHGGRQLDSTLSPIEIIHKHHEIVEDKIALMLDGGIGRGQDIFKSLALGANCVLLGRSMLWPLAVGGAQGVLHALRILQEELTEVMILSGCSNIAEINSSYIKKESTYV